MIACEKCSTSNSLDSTFCRKCGAEISETDIAEAREKLEVLVTEGNHAFNESRTEDALAISESVLSSDPNSTAALWLKAICHERRGEIPLALECADRIVELNPDSDLDKIRRTQLRNKLNLTLTINETPDKRFAAVMAACAALFVVCIGLLAAYMVQHQSNPAAVVLNTDTPKDDLAIGDIPTSQNDPQGNAANEAANQGSSDGSNQNSSAASGNPSMQVGPNDVPPVTQTRPSAPSPRVNGSIPLPSPSTGGVMPIPDNGNDGVTVEPPVNPVRPPVIDVKPKRSTPDDDPDGTFKVDQPKTNPGTIEVTIHTPKPGNSGNVSSSANSNGVEARVRTATQAFQVGNYTQAATLFEDALRQGGDPVRLNQRLGQSYERMGRSGDAIEAYRRAVQAGEAAIAQGKANPAGIRTTIESSQQALKNLGG